MIMPDTIERLIQLRTLIGFLGERTQFNWWDTQFLGSTSLSYLELNFPRTKFSAAIHSVTVAAKKIHDDRIGKGSIYHLFRLPAHYEQHISKHLIAITAEKLLKEKLLIALENKASALPALAQLTGNITYKAEGPVHLPGPSFFTSAGLDSAASYYYHAFIGDMQVFPYSISA